MDQPDTPLGNPDFFLRQAIESQSVAVFVLDREHRVLFWNRACEELTGVPASAMIGKAEAWRGFYPEARPTVADLVLEGREQEAAGYYAVQGPSALSGGAWHGEGWFSNIGGKSRYVIFDAAPIRDAQGQVWAAVETLQDITAHKQTEKRLHEREADLKKAQSLARIGNWRLDFATGAMTCSDEACRIFGLAAGSAVTPESFATFLPPDDLKLRQQAWEAALAGSPCHIEYRVVVDGRTTWVNEQLEVVRWDDGKPRYALGTIQDIDERRQFITAMSLRQAQYQAVVDAAADGFWMTDLEGRILDVNDAYLKRSGYTREEMLSLHAWDVDVELSRDDIIAGVLEAFEEGKGRFTSRHRAKDGRVWPVAAQLSYWPMGEGRIFAFFDDISAGGG